MALTIVVQISNDEEAFLLNDLLDVDDWVQQAVKGKINNCKNRLIRQWQPKLFADPQVTSVPADDTGFINIVLARPDYKDRAARDAEAKSQQ